MSVKLRIDGELAIITLDRPAALNALSFDILRELDEAIGKIEASAARGVIVTGAGEKSFCAGADIAELAGRSPRQELEGFHLGQRIFTRLSALRAPSVAVVHGYAFGGGLELALSCTFRVATRRARFGLPEVKLGVIPGYGGTQRLPRLIGEGRALEMILSGRTVEADEAERIGLVNRIDDGEPADTPAQIGARFLAPLLKHGLQALAFARAAVQRGMQTTLDQGLRIEADLSAMAFRTADAAEGMKAFMEKRAAVFKDE